MSASAVLCLFPCLLVPVLNLELNIVHQNDIHSRFVPAAGNGGRCKEGLACYGGFARIKAYIDEVKSTEKNVLNLNAGDNYQGTVWYTLYKGPLLAFVANTLDYDAMALGNHEFDDGPAGLRPFLKAVEFPVLAANVNATAEPLINGLFLPYVVVNVDGRHVGIIGFLTPDTESLANPGPTIKFEDEVTVLNKTAQFLTRQGVDIIIALGHSGWETDVDIAEMVPNIDVVVGGHTNEFLYNGVPPDPEDVAELDGPYPTVVKNLVTGDKVPVVQCFKRGKYICRLRVKFDEKGKAVFWEGQPVILGPDRPSGDVLLADVLSVIPFENRIYFVDLKGSTIKKILEFSVSNHFNQGGGFLQVSGFRIVYDLLRPKNQRLISVEARCKRCSLTDDQYESVEDDKIYTVAMSKFLYKGGDFYSMIEEEAVSFVDSGNSIEDDPITDTASAKPRHPDFEFLIPFIRFMRDGIDYGNLERRIVYISQHPPQEHDPIPSSRRRRRR
ncbi:unnamed protein product [Cyprideis torosa]|uniref:5'-nucleotidase n=1 Tax=Cyprideis torosa TaxID=163714 RepID=A0A7R8ZKP1_9CRUS|nr:unnamed protein product [Cyprideis torosa]CAG0884857.1 unnamed protein product [Cyprideis torosa]